MYSYNGKPVPEFLRIDIRPIKKSSLTSIIYKYDDKMILIEKYKSMKDAAEMNNITKSVIYNAIRKGIKSYGFYWKKTKP